MNVFSRSFVGPSGINADSLFISGDSNVFAVADGASGAYDKVSAGRICTEVIEENPFLETGKEPVEYINNCLSIANNRLVEKSQKDGALSFVTLTMAVIKGNTLIVGSVGDTPAYLYNGFNVRKLVKPYKRYAPLVEHGFMTEDEAERYINSLPDMMYSMFVMYIPEVIPKISLYEGKIKIGDVLVICSDGVSDWITEEQLFEILSKDKTLEYRCSYLLDKAMCNAGGSWTDDTTIIAVEI